MTRVLLLINIILRIYTYVIILKFILDIFFKNSLFKIREILGKIVDPVLDLVRKKIPTKAYGFDLSFLIVILFIQIIIQLIQFIYRII